MSEQKYPIRSTARVFHDASGYPCTLDQLIKRRPQQVKELLFQAEEKLEEVTAELEKSEQSLSALSTKYSAMCDEVDAVRGNLLNCNDTVIRLAGERDALQARLHGAQMCTVCAGDKESAKRINCICGGIGTIWAENDGLRQVLAETRDFKAELEHILKNTQAELAAALEVKK